MQVPDREEAFAVGQAVSTGDLAAAHKLLAYAEGAFAGPTLLPHHPDRDVVEHMLLQIRLNHLQTRESQGFDQANGRFADRSVEA